MAEQYISPELANELNESQLFLQLNALQGEVVRELEARRTFHTYVGDGHYYVKLHFGVGWGEIIKNLVQGRAPVLGAGNEWRALKRLHEAGVPTMTGVAFVKQGANPATQQSAIVTRALEAKISLEDYMPLRPALKRRLLNRVAKVMRGMHLAGVNHRDCYLCHFLMDEGSEEAPVLHLIDLHRAQVRNRVPDRWLIKDLGGLLFSAFEKQLTRRDLLRFARVYWDKPLREVLSDKKEMIAKIEARAAGLYLQDYSELPPEISRLLKERP